MPYSLNEFIKLFDHGASGIGVSLLISLLGYFRTRSKEAEAATLDDFAKWLDRNRHSEIINGQNELLEILKAEGEQANIVKIHIQNILLHMQSFDHKLDDIGKKVDLLPSIDQKVEKIIEELTKKETENLKKGQVAICTKVLNTISSSLVGAGLKVVLDSGNDMAETGTILVCWQLGSQSPDIMLLDLVGSIKENRLSLILNKNNSITLRVYDGNGKCFSGTSEPIPPSHYLLIFAIWEKDKFWLRINNSTQCEFTVSKPFEYLGPFCLFGMDIENELSADAIRWAPKGQPVGLQLLKDGICHNSLLDQIVMLSTRLENWQMDKFVEDPYALLRPVPNT